jgi:hypothetical protein
MLTKDATKAEPEPAPSCRATAEVVSYEEDVRSCVRACLQARHQLLQVALEVASMSCYFYPCAPIFLRLAENCQRQAGALMDVLVSQGATLVLPALEAPQANLSYNREEGEQTLAAALEACLHMEESKNFEHLSRLLKDRHGVTTAARQVVEGLSVESHRLAEQLLRVISTLLHSKSKLEGMEHFRSLFSAMA